jgi:hypothetical protein
MIATLGYTQTGGPLEQVGTGHKLAGAIRGSSFAKIGSCKGEAENWPFTAPEPTHGTSLNSRSHKRLQQQLSTQPQTGQILELEDRIETSPILCHFKAFFFLQNF